MILTFKTFHYDQDFPKVLTLELYKAGAFVKVSYGANPIYTMYLGRNVNAKKKLLHASHNNKFTCVA